MSGSARAVGALAQGAPVIMIPVRPGQTVRQAVAQVAAEVGVGADFLEMTTADIYALTREPRRS